MIYTLFVWTVVATQADSSANYQKTVYDWRRLTETAAIREDALTECRRVATELGIPRERYRCIRTK